ncbi:MAG: outer membrane protein assembly factor BamD [Deltaproteobacteria bacterium]|nr:outer membrane protein assembly factor BamD [Deltaproteobacteria bacterium]
MKIKKLSGILLIYALFSLLIPGCSIFQGPKDELEIPPQALIEEGMRLLKEERYQAASETFQKLRDRHIEAIEAYKDFETLHPKNEAIPYVIFQQGMCYYRQMKTLDRDQVPALKAAQTFSRLQRSFPQDKYAAQAENYLIEAQNMMAGHEFYVGEFYFKKKAYRAALGRFINLIKSFPDTGYHGKAMNYIKVCQEKIAAEEKAAEESE